MQAARQRLHELSYDLAAEQTADATWHTVREGLEDVGFTRVILSFRDEGANEHRTRSSMPRWWNGWYEESRAVARDPFFLHCCNSFQPGRSGAEYTSHHPFLSRDDVFFIDLAREAGFHSGLWFPEHLVGEAWAGGWNVGSEFRRAEADRVFGALQSPLAVALHAAHERLSEALRSQAWKSATLSPRERDCLSGLATGKHFGEISDWLEISYGTVEFHVRNARRKLQAATREQAVARAIWSGLIRI